MRLLLAWALASQCLANVCKRARIVVAGPDPKKQPAEFWLGHEKVPLEGGPGISVVTIDPVKQRVTAKGSYDVGSAKVESSFLHQDLESLPVGTIVLVSAANVSLDQLTPGAVQALQDVGCPLGRPIESEAAKLELYLRTGLAFLGTRGGGEAAGAQFSHGPWKVPPDNGFKGYRNVVEGVIPCEACRKAKIVSAGSNDGNRAEFWVAGEKIDFDVGSGLNVVTLDPVTQAVLSKTTYDLQSSEANDRITKDIFALPDNRIVLLAVKEGGMNRLGATSRNALHSVGATFFDEKENDGYALIGSKGGFAVQEEKGGHVQVEGELSCQGSGFWQPQELPNDDFPALTADLSNQAWPSGHQPGSLEYWPKDFSTSAAPGNGKLGRPARCWEVTVIDDTEDGWPGKCSGLQAKHSSPPLVEEPAPRPKRPASPKGDNHMQSAEVLPPGAEPQGCDKQWRMSLSGLTRSNLGGFGPDFGEETLVYRDVFPNSVFSRGYDISLVVTAKSGYEPQSVDDNGLADTQSADYDPGHVGKISVKDKSTAKLKFKFVDMASQQPVRVEPFYFSILNLDEDLVVGVSGFKTYTTGSVTKVNSFTTSEFSKFFGEGRGSTESVTNPEHLTEEEKKRALSILYPALEEFEIEVSSTKSAGFSGLTFAGATNLVCPSGLEVARRLYATSMMDSCRASCEEDPTCAVWTFTDKDGCWQGNGRHCHGLGGPYKQVSGAQRLQHGSVRVLKDISGMEIIGLYALDEFTQGSHDEAIRRCKEWCYSNIYCQFWQYGEGGCYVEAPDLQTSQVQYPLTLSGGATRQSKLARTISAGEYIQHYCPPKPLDVRGYKVIDGKGVMTTGAPSVADSSSDITTMKPSWWLHDVPSQNWPRNTVDRSQAAWTHGAQPPTLAAWPKDSLGDPFPCRQVTLLRDTAHGWPGKCRDLRLRQDVTTKEDCQLSCIMTGTCSVWQWVKGGQCYQGQGRDCHTGIGLNRHGRALDLEVIKAQRIQHGEVRVLKDISKLQIFGLFNLGVFSGGDVEEGIERCKHWCWSDIHCEYWQYGQKGCWVDAKAAGFGDHEEVEFPLTLQGWSPQATGGASLETAFARELVKGEYIQHYCLEKDVIRNYNGNWNDFKVELRFPGGKKVLTKQEKAELRVEQRLTEKLKEEMADEERKRAKLEEEKNEQETLAKARQKKEEAAEAEKHEEKGETAEHVKVKKETVEIHVKTQEKEVAQLAQEKLEEAQVEIKEQKAEAIRKAEKEIKKQKAEAEKQIEEAKRKARHQVDEQSEAMQDVRAKLKAEQQRVEEAREEAKKIMLEADKSSNATKHEAEVAKEKAEKQMKEAKIKQDLLFKREAAKEVKEEVAKHHKLLEEKYKTKEANEVERYQEKLKAAQKAKEHVAKEQSKGKDKVKERVAKEEHLAKMREAELEKKLEEKSKAKEQAAKKEKLEEEREAKLEEELAEKNKVKRQSANKVDALREKLFENLTSRDMDIDDLVAIIDAEKHNGDVKSEIAKLQEILHIAKKQLLSRTQSHTESHAENTKTIQSLKTRIEELQRQIQSQDSKSKYNMANETTALPSRAATASGSSPKFFTILILLCLAAALLASCYFAWSTRSRAMPAKTPDVSRTLKMDVFRLNATKDRYDYYEAMERAEGNYDADSMIPWAPHERFSGKKVCIVLEKCALELAHTLPDESSPIHRSENELLITHESLISLLDSPLNKAGKLLIYLHSAQDVLVEVHPSCRVPRVFSKFCQLIYELLRKGKVQGFQANFPLLQVVPGPVSSYLPVDCHRFALTPSGKACKLKDLCEATERESNSSSSQDSRSGIVVFAIGASEGDATVEDAFGKSYCNESVSICPWGLRAQCVCQMVCHEFENIWGVNTPEHVGTIAILSTPRQETLPLTYEAQTDNAS